MLNSHTVLRTTAFCLIDLFEWFSSKRRVFQAKFAVSGRQCASHSYLHGNQGIFLKKARHFRIYFLAKRFGKTKCVSIKRHSNIDIVQMFSLELCNILYICRNDPSFTFIPSAKAVIVVVGKTLMHIDRYILYCINST